ncbi:MAG: anti-sigma factor [Saprospiraceae bacterium]|nr:anti-sigma factor [Saprospiraceae bacterium]
MNQKINIQEIKDSGILEQYALGLTDAKQNEEINKWLADSDELQLELKEIQNSLEIFATQYAVPVPGRVKTNIIQRIGQELKMVELKSKYRRYMYQGIAAIGIPFIIVGSYLWMNYQSSRSELSILNQKLNEQTLLHIQDSLNLTDCNSRLEVLRNKDAKKILLKGTPVSPQAFASIYYDTLSHKTYLDVLDLPKPPSQKQYQLWAIVAGKPVDLGVFDLNEKQTAFKEIEFVKEAQAFAITLEPMGGVVSPTMDQMYVMGGVN